MRKYGNILLDVFSIQALLFFLVLLILETSFQLLSLSGLDIGFWVENAWKLLFILWVATASLISVVRIKKMAKHNEAMH